jgi:arginine decarboxylase
MPDFWGLNQKFPIMPIHHLDKKAVRPASLWDITCDSDGEIEFDEKSPLFLHDIDLKKKPYYLGFFLLGAYQDILGMKHNLFDRPSEVIVDIDEEDFTLRDVESSESISDILDSIGFERDKIYTKFKNQINSLNNISSQEKDVIFQNIYNYFDKDNYLKANEKEKFNTTDKTGHKSGSK